MSSNVSWIKLPVNFYSRPEIQHIMGMPRGKDFIALSPNGRSGKVPVALKKDRIRKRNARENARLARAEVMWSVRGQPPENPCTE